MKRYSLLVDLLVFLLSAPVFLSAPAFAQQGSACATASRGLGVNEKIASIESCLARVADSANVKEEKLKHKRAQCTQNAKNYGVPAANKERYVETCVARNDASSAYAAFSN